MGQRIVSLLPAATELMFDLGLGRSLVGRSQGCDEPHGVMRLPSVTVAQRQAHSLQIPPDRPAYQVVQRQLAPEPVDVEALIALQPDVIITQLPAGLQGPALDDLKRSLNSLIISRPQVMNMTPRKLEEVYHEWQKLADAFGVGARGKALIQKHHKLADSLAERTRNLARPRVLCLSSLSPLLAAGSWVPTLFEIAGGQPLVAAAGEPSRRLAWSELRALDPDLVVIALAEAGSENDDDTQTQAMFAVPQFRSLRATKAKRVFAVNGHQLFNRPGPRLYESIQAAAEMCHPDLMGIRHLGKLWSDLF